MLYLNTDRFWLSLIKDVKCICYKNSWWNKMKQQKRAE